MLSKQRSIVEFFRREDGPTSNEYAVMIALIAAVIIASVSLMGNRSKGSLSRASQPAGGDSGMAIGATATGGTAASIGIFTSTTYHQGDNELFNAATNQWTYSNAYGTFTDHNNHPGYLPGSSGTTWTRIE